jgi:hypothetical protein
MLGDGSRGHRARGSPGAATGPSGGSWSHGARGSLGVVLCPGTGARATGHVAVPELPWPWWRELESRGGPEAALCQEMGAAGDAHMCARLAFHL